MALIGQCTNFWGGFNSAGNFGRTPNLQVIFLRTKNGGCQVRGGGVIWTSFCFLRVGPFLIIRFVKKNVLLYFSHFFLSPVFLILFQSRQFTRYRFLKLRKKSGRGKIRGLYRRRKDTELPSRLGTTCLKLSRTYLCVMMCSNPITDFFNFEENPLIKKLL